MGVIVKNGEKIMAHGVQYHTTVCHSLTIKHNVCLHLLLCVIK